MEVLVQFIKFIALGIMFSLFLKSYSLYFMNERTSKPFYSLFIVHCQCHLLY